MIIAYYAGSGGHTYVKHLLGHNVQYGHHDLEYIVSEKDYIQYPIIMTHCLNYNLLKKKFPEQTDIRFLIANPIDCWRRKFIIYTKNHNIKENEKYDFAVNYINQVKNYYNLYPVQYGDAKIFNLEVCQDSIFANLLENIKSAKDEVFDQAFLETI